MLPPAPRKIFIPLDKLLMRGKLLRADVEAIEPHAVVLKGSGERVPFDFLVVATGSSYLSPIKGGP